MNNKYNVLGINTASERFYTGNRGKQREGIIREITAEEVWNLEECLQALADHHNSCKYQEVIRKKTDSPVIT